MLKAGRELDIRIASEVLQYPVTRRRKEVFEAAPKGSRPLRAYSTDIGAAWEIIERFGITLIPIEDGSWFSFVGNKTGWSSPAEFIQSLQNADFMHAGAAVAETPALSACLAALKASEKRAPGQTLN